PSTCVRWRGYHVSCAIRRSARSCAAPTRPRRFTRCSPAPAKATPLSLRRAKKIAFPAKAGTHSPAESRSDDGPRLAPGMRFGAADRHRAHPDLDRRTHELDVQEPVFEPSAPHLDPLGQHKRALELARRDAAVEIDALRIVGLLAADHELTVLDRDREVGHRK